MGLQEVERLLTASSPEVRATALHLRALIFELMPDSVEQVDFADRLVAYGLTDRMADVVFVIFPLKSAVNLGISRGAELADPAGLLAGTGKRHRHVRIQTAANADSPELRHLMAAAVAARRPD